MKRIIDLSLQNWKESGNRRILLLRGARQVGKTYSIRQLGKQFDHYIEINFERDMDVRTFFEGTIDPQDICNKLSVYSGKPIVADKTLLFFDEIQAFPVALHALRFFYEIMPSLHVIAAGSLLEFALSEIPSQGVGRLTSLFMYPLCFREFLWAMGQDRLEETLGNARASHGPFEETFHRKCLDFARMHMLLGGMPAVVSEYAERRDALACQTIIDDLLVFLRDDFAKYKTRISPVKLDETLLSAAQQAGGKFKYTAAAGSAPIAGYKDALGLLEKAGLVHRVCHTSARGLPLGSQKDEKKIKAFPLDTGIYQRMLGLDMPDHISKDPVRLINEGAYAEVYAGIEIIAGMPQHMRPELYYWHREAAASNAEIDYVFAYKGKINAVEVKAATKGGMKSLHEFLRERPGTRGMRLSHENFGSIGAIDIAPFYASCWLPL